MPSGSPLDAKPLFRPLQSLVRLIPAQARGKQHFVRLFLSDSLRCRAGLVHDRQGNSFFVPSLLDTVGFHLWMDGVYEPDTLAFLRCELGPGDVFVDVGANIGVFSIPLARHVGQTGKVVAIEASPSVSRILKANIEANRLDNVLMVDCAASLDGQDCVDFYEAPPDHFGMGSSGLQFDAKPLTVAAKSLDGILAGQSVKVMKVDVEGYEAHVFMGGSGLLSRKPRPSIVFEFCDWAEERAFPGRRGWAQNILLDAGYRLWTLAAYTEGKPPLDEPIRTGTVSIVAIPLERDR